MTAVAGTVGRRQSALQRLAQPVSAGCFAVYVFFLLEFFLHFSARVPSLGVLRPTLLSAAVLALMLYLQRDRLIGRFDNVPSQRIRLLLLYLLLSLPFVTWPGSVLNNAADFIKAVAFFFFTVAVLDTEKRLRVALFIFIGCQVFRVLEPLYLHVTDGYWGSSTYIGDGEFAERLSGAPADVINPNELGFVIATAVPFLYYLVWPVGWKGKLLLLGLMPCLLYALMLTMSRGGFLALLVVCFFILRESKNRGLLIGLGVVAVVALWSVMSPIQKDRYLSLVDDDTVGAKSREGRLEGMIAEFQLGLERPIFGHGLGTTAEAKFHLRGKTQAAHNFYAELLMEVGLVGMVIFLRYMAGLHAHLRQQVQARLASVVREDFRWRLHHALLAVFWMYVVYSFNYWGLSQYYWYFLGGLMVAYVRLLDTEMSGQEVPVNESTLPRSARRALARRRN